jgi:hypothetical protein
MARTQRLTRFAILIPFAYMLWAGVPVSAQAQSGLTANYYIINETPPIKSGDVYEACGVEIENNINRNFEGEPFVGCPDDLFMVHYTGFITLPAHNSIQFWLAADDGGTMKIGDYEWGTWIDKGCSAEESAVMTLPVGEPLVLDGWFYENSGGTCFMLAWNIDGQGWEMVPDDAFTVSLPATTTTEAPTTTQAPTTTEMPTTTTEPAPTSTAPTSTTTTSSSSTTSTPTTTSLPYQPPESTQPTTPEPPTETQTTHQQDQQIQIPLDPPPTSQPVQTSAPVASLPVQPATSVPDATTTTTPLPDQQTSTTMPSLVQPSLPPTEDYQSAQIINGGVIGVGLKPPELISNGLRKGITPAQQRAVVAAAVLIAMPSPLTGAGARGRRT